MHNWFTLYDIICQTRCCTCSTVPAALQRAGAASRQRMAASTARCPGGCPSGGAVSARCACCRSSSQLAPDLGCTTGGEMSAAAGGEAEVGGDEEAGGDEAGGEKAVGGEERLAGGTVSGEEAVGGEVRIAGGTVGGEGVLGSLAAAATEALAATPGTVALPLAPLPHAARRKPAHAPPHAPPPHAPPPHAPPPHAPPPHTPPPHAPPHASPPQHASLLTHALPHAPACCRALRCACASRSDRMSCCPFSRASAASAAATSSSPSPPPPPPPRAARCRSGLPLEPPLKREGKRGPHSGERRARLLVLVPPPELPPDSRPEEWRKGEGEPLDRCDGGVRGERGERCKPSP